MGELGKKSEPMKKFARAHTKLAEKQADAACWSLNSALTSEANIKSSSNEQEMTGEKLRQRQLYDGKCSIHIFKSDLFLSVSRARRIKISK